MVTRKAPLPSAKPKPKLKFYFISFATDYQFLGGLVIQGTDAKDALRQAKEKGLHPGGDPLTTSLTAGDMRRIPEDLRGRLLSHAECIARLAARRI